MDFRYLAQAPQILEAACTMIDKSLALFHENKQAILDAGARRGKKNKPINNWHIPKLELFQSVVPSIRSCGAPIQWSADVTERAHITEIKVPSHAANSQLKLSATLTTQRSAASSILQQHYKIQRISKP